MEVSPRLRVISPKLREEFFAPKKSPAKAAAKGPGPPYAKAITRMAML